MGHNMGHTTKRQTERRLQYPHLTASHLTKIAGMMATLSCFLSTPSWANVPPATSTFPVTEVSPLPASGDARAPYGWVDFCAQSSDECAVDTQLPEKIHLTPEVWRTLTRTNEKINHDIKPMTDSDHWGVVERWDIPTDGKGDCEDYVLLKRQQLVNKGFSSRALRITVVVDENNDGHAVLMVRTTRGDFILDNKRDTVLPWYDTGYIYVKRERQDGIGWTSLGGVASPQEVASH
jgi:predicted transglutaminase-like cysteine proteinase